MIDLEMALYDPVRIKDKRRQFLNFWQIDLIQEEMLLTSVSLRTGPVGNVIISKEEAWRQKPRYRILVIIPEKSHSGSHLYCSTFKLYRLIN